MPLLTELPSAPDIWNGKDPFALLNEFENGAAEEWVDRDIEPSVSYKPKLMASPRAQRRK